MAIIIGKNLNFLVAAPSSTPASFFTVILTGTKQLFDCGLSKKQQQQQKNTILLTFCKYWGVTYFF